MILQESLDNVDRSSITPNSIQAQLENKITSFIRNFKAPGPVFDPIPICQMTMDNYMALFPNNDGRCGAKVYFEDGTLYLLDTLSYLHGTILGFVTDSLILNNSHLVEYFNRSSYSKK